MSEFFTDYPITQLGDTPGEVAPVRACRIVEYDGDKYVTVEVEGERAEIKAGYIYPRPARCGDCPPVKRSVLRQIARRP
jgi:hypothetical protein